MITIKLNGKDIKTEEGKTILEVAEANGIRIPTLCHDKELKPFGSCWICAVEVKGRRGFVTACGTLVLDGMDIVTDSDDIHMARKMALELLLSDHYADCEAPCKLACPDKVDVQTYVSLIANGQHQEAVRVIKENLPMPLSIGRVCPAFCEAECRRAIVEDPIAIRQLKRHAADFDLNSSWSYVPERSPLKNMKIAVVGAGPSGLTCGYYLSNRGYDVTVYEASEKAGGWLRYGIPEYRLPKKILDQEIELMCRNGMKIETGIAIGKDVSISELSRKFDAVYLALGAQNAVPMRIKGSEFKGCFLGVDFLKDHVLGNKPKLGKKVAVVGGGNTAIDCARTARRLGSEVIIIYRRTRKEMPAEAYEVDAAEEEGVKFYFLTNPVENLAKKGKLSAVKLEKMKLGDPDESGRRRPEPTGELFEEEFDSLIAAISQSPDVNFLSEDENKIDGKEIPLTRWSTAVVNEDTMYLGLANIFAGGDFQRGPATAIEAIADGRIAADSIDRFLNGEEMKGPDFEFDSKKSKRLKEIETKYFKQYKKINRFQMPELEAEDRVNNFGEVELGFSEDDARAEAERGLECGCQVNLHCSLRQYSTEYGITPEKFSGDKNKYQIDLSHPFILRDPNKCIKCGRCVRICLEVQGPGVLGYINRGFISTVVPEFGESLKNTDCESCGKCIEVCPVGALTPRNINYKTNPHILEKVTQNCGLCGTGCKIDAFYQNDRIVYINPAEEEGFNDRNLCFAGKFGWQMLEDKDRINSAFLKNEDNLENKDEHWSRFENVKDALAIIKKKLAAASTKKIYISAMASNEELLLMQEVARNAGAELSSISYDKNFVDDIYDTTMLSKNYDDLKEAEVIFIVGKISHTLKIMARAEQRKGKRLIMITNEKTDFTQFADDLFDEEPITDTLEKILETYYEEESEDSDDDREDKALPIDLDLPEKTMFLYCRENLTEESIWNIWMLSYMVCDYGKGSGVMPTSDFANFRGLKQLGIKPGKPQSSDFVLLYGELPCEEPKKMLKNSKFILSVNTHLDDSDPCHMILPMPSYLEIDATAIANDGRLTEFKNPKKSDVFIKYLHYLHEMGLISSEQTDPAYWQQEARKIFSQSRKLKPMSDQQLFDYLNSLEKVAYNKPKHFSMQKKKIDQLKKLTKN